jgi:hypothetical protein
VGGRVNGRPGKGSVRWDYTRALNDRFIHGRNRSEYPAQEKNPKGEIHEHEDWISFDRIGSGWSCDSFTRRVS